MDDWEKFEEFWKKKQQNSYRPIEEIYEYVIHGIDTV